MGGRLMLSNITDNDIDGSPQFSQWQKVLLHTMLDYGLIINDTGSGAMFGLQTESNLPYQLQSVPDPWWEMVAGDPAHQLNTCISTRGWETYTASTPNGDLDPGENYCVGKFVGNSLSSIPPDFWLTHLIVAKPRADVVGLSASSGPASGGFQVTIYGHNLGQLFVQFVSHKPGGGGRPALYPRAAPDGQSATFTVPPGPAEVEDLDIGNNSFANETAQIRIRDAFTFLP